MNQHVVVYHSEAEVLRDQFFMEYGGQFAVLLVGLLWSSISNRPRRRF